MTRFAAAAGSVLFFLAAPCVVAGFFPWLITGWEFDDGGGWLTVLRIVGTLLILAGLLSIIESFVRFVRDGRGTPAPVAAPEHLVIRGQYRFNRNPMYVAVSSMILGQALALPSAVLLAYLALVIVAFASFVRFYEEPALEARFGDEYTGYKKVVPAWWIRL
jgi:protein-S-isoprenylcysteine O-methyltransferase Ste14